MVALPLTELLLSDTRPCILAGAQGRTGIQANLDVTILTVLPWVSGFQVAIDKPSDVPLLSQAVGRAQTLPPRPGVSSHPCDCHRVRHSVAQSFSSSTYVGIPPALSVSRRVCMCGRGYEERREHKALGEAVCQCEVLTWCRRPVTQAGFLLVLQSGRVLPAL